MAERKSSGSRARQPAKGFSDEEKAAMREAVRERKASQRGSTADGEAQVLAKIAEMGATDRVLAQRLHSIIKANAPALSPKTWYGMPAYAKDDQVVCFFQPGEKFKTRYATLGFSDEATLDEGEMWPTAFALKKLSAVEEARIIALIKRAVG